MELILTGYIDSWQNKQLEMFKQGIVANRQQPLQMVICSGGGSVIEGLEVSALIKTHEATTKAVCVGFVASIASVIALSADKVVMDENATMLIHNASGGNYGTADDLRETAEQLDQFTKQIMSYYIGRIAKNGKLVNNSVQETEKMLAECMEQERILSAAECLKMGLIDRIINAQIPAQVSDNSEELAQQINAAYPTAAAKYNFTNCFSNMNNKEEETPAPVKPVQQDKKGLFKAFTDAFAALFGFNNEAAAAQQPAIEAVPEVQPAETTNEEQKTEEMTEQQMIQHLKEKGFDVSKAEETPAEETAPEVQKTEEAAPVSASFENAALMAEFEAMKQQLEEMKAAAFAAKTTAAGLNETAADVKNVQTSALKQKVYAAVGGNLFPEFQKLKK